MPQEETEDSESQSQPYIDTELESLERSYRRVFGRPGHRTDDQKAVYKNLRETADLPGGSELNGFQTNPILLNEGSRIAILNILALADKNPNEDEENQTKIIKTK